MAVVWVKHALTGFPVSLGQPYVAEHLKQAAKVRGLGVERQLKVAPKGFIQSCGLNL
jgi:hypothetical protein